MQTEIKKGNGIEDLFRGFAAGKPEEEKLIKVVGESAFKRLMAQYIGFIGFRDYEGEPPIRLITSLMLDSLTPEQINAFLQTTSRYEQYKGYCWGTGRFISAMVQKSYDAGHNRFHLNTTALQEINLLYNQLKGRPDEPIQVTHTGNIGEHCGDKACYLIIDIRGDTGDACGVEVYNSMFNIRGNTGDWYGSKSNFSTFNITGDTGDQCGDLSGKSTFNITGDTGLRCGQASINSTFKTPNRKTLEKMLKDVSKYNRVIFINPDGTEEIVRDYANKS